MTSGNDLGLLKDETSDSKPWVKQSIDLQTADFPKTVKIVKAGMLFIKKTGLNQKILNTFKRFAAFENSEFYIEDLQHGQKIESLTILNPFQTL